MSEKKTDKPVEQKFAFDKFVEDLERRENLQKEQAENTAKEINDMNRQRDARNREHLHNRMRWRR